MGATRSNDHQFSRNAHVTQDGGWGKGTEPTGQESLQTPHRPGVRRARGKENVYELVSKTGSWGKSTPAGAEPT